LDAAQGALRANPWGELGSFPCSAKQIKKVQVVLAFPFYRLQELAHLLLLNLWQTPVLGHLS